jgi:hypothetical protein
MHVMLLHRQVTAGIDQEGAGNEVRITRFPCTLGRVSGGGSQRANQ